MGPKKHDKYTTSHVIKIYKSKLRLNIADIAIHVEVTYYKKYSQSESQKKIQLFTSYKNILRVVKRRLKIEIAKYMPEELKQ